jgi:hypothetical protein
VKISRSEINTFLDGVHIARVATVRPDGRPHIAPVWYIWEDNTFYFESEGRTVKVENLKRNPNIAIAVDITAGGLDLKYVILEGRAEFIEELEEVKEIANRIYRRYVGQHALETRPIQEMLELADLIVSLKPTRFITMDYL